MKRIEKEIEKISARDKILYVLTVLDMVGGFALLFIGITMDPKGEIHDSVLIAFGLVLLFVASAFGLSIAAMNAVAGFRQGIVATIAESQLVHNMNQSQHHNHPTPPSTTNSQSAPKKKEKKEDKKKDNINLEKETNHADT